MKFRSHVYVPAYVHVCKIQNFWMFRSLEEHPSLRKMMKHVFREGPELAKKEINLKTRNVRFGM